MLGLLQGVSELFPVSSLGHSVILPRLVGWHIHQNDKFFITFLVAVHLATALVLLGFFWRDWVRVVTGLGRSLRDREISDPDARLGWLLDPAPRHVYVYRPDADVERLDDPETVAGDPVLPGFVLKLREIW